MQSMIHVRLHQDINLLLLGFLVYKHYRKKKKRPISVHSLRNLLLFINNDITEHEWVTMGESPNLLTITRFLYGSEDHEQL